LVFFIFWPVRRPQKMNPNNLENMKRPPRGLVASLFVISFQHKIVSDSVLKKSRRTDASSPAKNTCETAFIAARNP